MAHFPDPARNRTGPASSACAPKMTMATNPSKHKVVLESVTQEKKKLRSVLSFKAEPPRGYTFIPAGNPELTNALKEFARNGSHEIYAVSTTPHQRAHDLSQQVHRIGFHFPSVVVAQVCAYYGIVLTSAGTVLAEEESQSFHRRSQRLKEQPAAEERKDQVTINTEARDTIRDLFPNIPDNDLNQIIKTAFQKGQGKVGTAIELSLIRRAQLAVVAHIRHVYTDYDKLLRQTHYREARNLVERPTLRRLVQWRGDDENGKQVLEDVFREVVVISDDEDTDEEEHQATKQFRDVSVEVVSSNIKANHFDLEPVEHENSFTDGGPRASYHANGKRSSKYDSFAAPTRKEAVHDREKVNRRGFSRYQAWNEAREEYRANPADEFLPNEQVSSYGIANKPSPRQEVGLGSSTRRPETSLYAPRKAYHDQEITPYPYRDTPEHFRAQDGTLYERVIKLPSVGSQQPANRSYMHESRNSATAEKVRSMTESNHRRFQNGGSDLDTHRDTIIPSIEGPPHYVTSSRAQAVGLNHPSTLSMSDHRAAMTKIEVERSVDQIEFLDLTEEPQNVRKRRRFEATDAETSKLPRTAVVAPYLPSRQSEPNYISLLSPEDRYSQPANFSALSSPRHQGSRAHGQVPPVAATYPDGQVFGSPNFSHQASDSLVACRPAGQVSNLRQFRSREVLPPSTSSPRFDELLMPTSSRSGFVAGSSPVDRGIQEYRAFRARERQDKTLASPSGRRKNQLREVLDLTGTEMTIKTGRLAQFDGTSSSRDRFPQLQVRTSSQDFFATGDSVLSPRDDQYPSRDRILERELPLRRRSASPIHDPGGSRRNYVPAASGTHVRDRQEAGAEYISGNYDEVPQRSQRFEPLIVTPTQRYEQGSIRDNHYQIDDYGEGEAGNSNHGRHFAHH